MMVTSSLLLHVVVLFFLTRRLAAAKTPKQAPRCALGKPFTPPVRDIPNNAAVLQIYGPKNWLPSDVTQLRLSFSPPLVQGEDFTVWSEPNEYDLPVHYQVKPYPTVLHILLIPGKKWIKEWNPHLSQPLVLESILCHHRPNQLNSTSTNTNDALQNIRIGNIISEYTNCPKITLPGASVELQAKVSSVLHHCQNPMISKSRSLNWKRHHSLALLMMQPAVMFVDGSDQTMLQAAKSVDRFLAAHSVLDIVWEPMKETDPQYWILMPRPLGMPGHLFALLDLMQWRHRLVSGDQFLKDSSRVSCSGKDCVPGCKHTQLAGISGSGYSADAFNIYNVLRVGFMQNLPVQAFPSTLGKRSIPPSKSPCII